MKHFIESFRCFFSKTIRRKLVSAFLFLIILPIAFSSIFSFIILQDVVKKKANIGNQAAISQVCINIERIFRDMLIASNTLMLDEEVLGILSKGMKPDVAESYMNYHTMYKKIFKVQTSSLDSYPNNIVALIDKKGNVYDSILKGSNLNAETFRDIVKKERLSRNNYLKYGENVYPIDALSTGSKMNYVVLVRSYMDVDFGTRMGDLIIALSEKDISSVLKGLGADNGIKGYIVSSNGQVISSTEGSEIGSGFRYFESVRNAGSNSAGMIELKGENCIINYQRMERVGWNIVEVIPSKVLFSEISATRNLLIYINLVFILIFFSVSYKIAKSISKPINKLNLASTEISSGNLEARVDVNEKGELGQLAGKFNIMAARIQELFKKVNDEERAKRELEIQMLYAQINPHFLFNTLNSIRWMADASKVFNVSKSIVALANLLKSSIIKTNEYLTIREEIENIKYYVTLQKLRNASLFEDEYAMDDEILEYKILKLILQPIVENSIIHGFEGITYKGVIKLKGFKKDNKIMIVISDNGTGMNEDQLRDLLNCNLKSKGRFSGIGIPNVNERLVLHFGREYGLDISSEPGKGMTTVLTMPIIHTEG